MRVKQPVLKEGIDYYFNPQGLFVFTKEYLKKRGFCCQNKCQNCPYPKEKKVKNKALKT